MDPPRDQITLFEVLQSCFLNKELFSTKTYSHNVVRLDKCYKFICESFLIDLIFTKLLFAHVAIFFGHEEPPLKVILREAR